MATIGRYCATIGHYWPLLAQSSSDKRLPWPPSYRARNCQKVGILQRPPKLPSVALKELRLTPLPKGAAKEAGLPAPASAPPAAPAPVGGSKASAIAHRAQEEQPTGSTGSGQASGRGHASSPWADLADEPAGSGHASAASGSGHVAPHQPGQLVDYGVCPRPPPVDAIRPSPALAKTLPRL